MYKTAIPILFTFLMIFASDAFAATLPYFITSNIGPIPIYRGATFFTKDITINYESGDMVLSSNDDGIGNTLVDDAIEITVTRPDNTIATFNYGYHAGCWALYDLPPKDLTYLFLPGENKVKIRMYDICGINAGSSLIYLVNLDAPDPLPTPFLNLPWDYEGKGLTFNEAALSINSFFDHEYPLLSAGLADPSDTGNSVITYKGPPRSTDDYSRHDGYDYGRAAKANFGDPVLAAADG